MPTYEYRCSNCDYVYDVFHKMSQAPLTECPKCSKQSLKRSIGGKEANLQFKGSGFYITDYAKKPSKDSSKSKEEK